MAPGPLWCLEGLLINWLLVRILREVSPRSTADEESSPTRDDGTMLISSNLLVESSNQSQEGFRLMVESVADYAIVMLGPDGRITSWNLGPERIFGYSAEEF